MNRGLRKHTRARAVALAVALAGVLSGCNGGAVTMQPAAYGQVVNGQGRCYYVVDSYEAQQLLAAGLCPAGWVPYQAPLSWEETYFAYYDSPAYYNRYVLPAHQTMFVATETTFQKTYAVQISTAAKTATYRGSNGKTVVGPSTAKLKFSSGSGSKGLMNGGSLRTGPTTAPVPAVKPAVPTAKVTKLTPVAPRTAARLTGGSLRKAH